MKCDNVFYHRPLPTGFSKQPVGQHTLEGCLSSMIKECGLVGYFTLHSLRATCATRLYNRGMDEQVIMEVTGHTSSAVREYKRTSNEMKRMVSST